jgi:hypothetical protein
MPAKRRLSSGRDCPAAPARSSLLLPGHRSPSAAWAARWMWRSGRNGSLAGNDMATALSIFLSCSSLRPNSRSECLFGTQWLAFFLKARPVRPTPNCELTAGGVANRPISDRNTRADRPSRSNRDDGLHRAMPGTDGARRTGCDDANRVCRAGTSGVRREPGQHRCWARPATCPHSPARRRSPKRSIPEEPPKRRPSPFQSSILLVLSLRAYSLPLRQRYGLRGGSR